MIAVADAKYKRVGKKGVSTNDVSQALAYATRYGLTECTLIYPERPPVDRVEVRDITIRLAAVEIDRPRSERTTSIAALADLTLTDCYRSIATAPNPAQYQLTRIE